MTTTTHSHKRWTDKGGHVTGAAEKRVWGVECNSFGEGCAYRLDENAFQIQLAKQLPEHSPLVVASGGIAGLADGYAQCGRIQRHLGDESGSACNGGLDRHSLGVVSHHVRQPSSSASRC